MIVSAYPRITRANGEIRAIRVGREMRRFVCKDYRAIRKAGIDPYEARAMVWGLMLAGTVAQRVDALVSKS
jgi:hypothetical protein